MNHKTNKMKNQIRIAELEAQLQDLTKNNATLQDIVLEKDNEIAKLAKKMSDVIEASNNMIERRDDRITELGYQVKGRDKLIRNAHLEESSLKKRVNDLQYQVKQRDELIKNAHNLLSIEAKRYDELKEIYTEGLA